MTNLKLLSISVATALLLSAQPVQAQTIGVHLLTAHFDGYHADRLVRTETCQGDPNDPNSAISCTTETTTVSDRKSFETMTPGMYLRMDHGAWSGATVGAYLNSYGRLSGYGAWTFETPSKRFALTVGAVTGYSKTLSALLVPSVRFEVDQGTFLRTSVMVKNRASGLHFSIERAMQ